MTALRPCLQACAVKFLALCVYGVVFVAAAPGDEKAEASPNAAGSISLTVLGRYVAAPDNNFSYNLAFTASNTLGSLYVLDMTSQSWLTDKEVDKRIWKHWVSIGVPSSVSTNTAMLFIKGGRRNSDVPHGLDEKLQGIAVDTKSVVVELYCVPNQPLVFGGDGHQRVEDNLVAYTWDQYLRTGDERWPANLPMTKSAVRAMDAVTEFLGGPHGKGVKIDNFIVAGMSKRGWTTWTTAAVDRRVVGIIPMVIDMLNMGKSMLNHYASYGFWAPAVHDYAEQHIMDRMNTVRAVEIMRIADPFSYNERYTMPKLILNATGDQFFTPDSSRFYFDALPGEKYLRYVPNADHSLQNSDAWDTVHAFYEALLTSTPLPRFLWVFQADGSIQVQTVDKPKTVLLWQATNPTARDFRIEKLGAKWKSTPLTLTDNQVVARVETPAKGWTAFMVELTYDRPHGPPLKFTTAVNILPDKRDFAFTPVQ